MDDCAGLLGPAFSVTIGCLLCYEQIRHDIVCFIYKNTKKQQINIDKRSKTIYNKRCLQMDMALLPYDIVVCYMEEGAVAGKTGNPFYIRIHLNIGIGRRAHAYILMHRRTTGYKITT